MKLIRILAIVFICTLTVISTNAQTKIKTEANADIVEYTTKDGLPTTNFSRIIQTKDGYIWLSGIEGTYRFDGYEFDEVGQEYGVPQMQNIYYDSTKNVLYFASPKKFIIFDGEKYKVYTEKEGYKINGLAGQIVNLLKADSRGRIWIGSSTPFVDKKYNGGLTMFEKGKFTVYDSTSFPLHNVDQFIETPYGDIIFGSNGKNTQTGEGSYIALYKNGIFKKIDESEGIYLQNPNIVPQNFIPSIDKDGNTWIAFTGVNTFSGENTFSNRNTAGLLMYDGNNFHQYPELNDLIKSFKIPLFLSYSKALDKLLLTTFTPEPTLFNSNNKNILELREGKWVYSDFFKKVKFVNELNTNKKINDFSYSASFYIKANHFFPELLVFTSISNNQTQSSKYPNQFYTYQNSNWKKYDSFNGFPTKELKDGYLINTTKGFGIYYPNKSKMLTPKDGLLVKQSGIPIIYPDRNGIVWISYSYTDLPAYANINNAGINIWDGKKLNAYTEKEGLKSNITFNTFQDSKYRIWIPTAKGITKAREIKNSEGNWIFKFENIPNNKRNNYNVTDVLETSNGDIYAWQNYVRPAYGKITGANFYLGKFDGEKFNEINSPFPKEDKNKKYQLIHLIEANDGKLWFEGLFADNIKDLTSVPSRILIYDGKTWSKPTESWHMPNEQLHYVGKLKNGMYFLTVGGFYNFDGNKFVDLSDSVDANADFRILKGASVAGTHTNIQSGERLYIRLRNRGLVIFDGKHLNFYTKKDGLPSANISNPGVDYKGNVTFGFPSGALVVNEEKFQTYYDDENIVRGGPSAAVKDINGDLVMFYNGIGLYIRNSENKNYPLKISSVLIDTASYFYNFPQDLSHIDNSLIFNFGVLNFKDPKQTNYEYILEGYDIDWSRPGNLSFAQYQNLPPGDYNFRVKGITSNGVKTNEAAYKFIIAPPFWKTWWAYTFYVLIIGFGLYSLRRYEKRRMKLREAERVRKERGDARLREAELRAQISEAENERKTKELEEARELQLSMLPRELPNLPNIEIAVYMKTATEVGGDYYDFSFSSDGSLNVAIGDATGHGMKAGTLVSLMKALFTTDSVKLELDEFFSSSNKALKKMRMERVMMGFAMVNVKGNKLNLINAGMPPIYLYQKSARKTVEISEHCMPLGALAITTFNKQEHELASGDTLLMISDGYPELQNGNEELFGYERVTNEFFKVAEQSPEKIIESLNNAGDAWADNGAPDDDITFVVIKAK